MKSISVITLGPAAAFPAVLGEAATLAFPGSALTAVADPGAALATPYHPGTALLLLGGGGTVWDTPPEAALDAESLPRWGVLRFGPEDGSLPGDGWTAPALAALLTQAAARQAHHRDNARLRGDLLTMARRVGHDLRTPLGGIIATVDMLAETLPGAEDASKPVFSSIDEITKIITRTSFLLKAIAQPPSPQNLNMGDTVREALLRLERPVLQKQAVIHQPAAWPDVSGVPAWLDQIWWNLLHNALHHSGPSPVVTLTWETVEEGLRFTIRDTGHGAAARAFSPFHRLHDPQAPHGLGLPIVRRLVELLGGTCGWTGDGFQFTLPGPAA